MVRDLEDGASGLKHLPDDEPIIGPSRLAKLLSQARAV